jgi:hypothetical protein
MSKSKILRGAVLLGAVVVIAAAAVSASPTAAARGGKKGGGQTPPPTTTPIITLNQTDPHLGDTVTFTVNMGTSIEVYCIGSSIYDLLFDVTQPVGTSFLLGGTNSIWLSRGGGANCRAILWSGGVAVQLTTFWADGAR